ncbi:uncharacterized protein LOC116844028 [Odontomachus brunneus]|uniref:uncharacterized protein LOC116844028 n=1 Tax=Odontomachus brunneus TaxID=486640 RepID=UPI0013F28B5D|nr:uncharacterized protein LOC116844028 [Odontomachus brunneus]
MTRRAAYWWSAEIAELRRSAGRAWRAMAALRDRDARVAASAVLTARRDAVRTAIARAKAATWEDLISSVDRDPWGRPYRMVMRRLRPWAPPVTDTLSPELLDKIVEGLFPRVGNNIPPYTGPPPDWEEGELGVTAEEMRRAAKRLGAKGKAPGPDGIPGRAWALALAQEAEVGDRLRRLFTRCLEAGLFPAPWKRARLAFLRKEGKPEESPSAYRPLCLLDEAGKMFERIMQARLVRHLSRSGPALDDAQYGFREGRSTVDAIMRVRFLSEAIVEAGMTHFGFPLYLVHIIKDYFRGRRLEFRNKAELQCGREVHCGVPQGEWVGRAHGDLTFRTTQVLTGHGCFGEYLHRIVRRECTSRCHHCEAAEDTAQHTLGECPAWEEERRVFVGVVGADLSPPALIRAMLEGREAWSAVTSFCKDVMSQKEEQERARRGETFVGGGEFAAPPALGRHTNEAPARLLVSPRSGIGLDEYLGFLLDGRWKFVAQFQHVASKVSQVGNAFASLMRNIGGPSWRIRRLYLNVVVSVAIYSAPVWSGTLQISSRSKWLFRSQCYSSMRPVAPHKTETIFFHDGEHKVSARLRVARGYPPGEVLEEESGDHDQEQSGGEPPYKGTGDSSVKRVSLDSQVIQVPHNGNHLALLARVGRQTRKETDLPAGACPSGHGCWQVTANRPAGHGALLLLRPWSRHDAVHAGEMSNVSKMSQTDSDGNNPASVSEEEKERSL